MKKFLMTIILFMIAISCYSEDGFKIFYKKEYVKSEYNPYLYDSIYALSVPENYNAFNGCYLIMTESFDIKKKVAIRYNLFFINKDVLSEYLLTLESFDRTLSRPSYKEFLEVQTKEEFGLFELLDSEVKASDETITKTFYYMYVKDLQQE